MFWEFGSSQVAPAEDAAEPVRNDEDVDDRAADQEHEGESRDEEKTEAHNKLQHEHSSRDVSMLSTLTDLLFNPFLDGYCKTPFCSSDVDYLPPSCPAGGFYYTYPENNKNQPEEGGERTILGDTFGDICMSPSNASSGAGSHARKRRQRPLALAVGYGHDWKDMEGRRVVITPSSTRLSQYQQQQGRHPSPYRPGTMTTTTYNTTAATSTNSLVSPERNDNHAAEDGSPHQTKNVMCSNKFRDLAVPASHSSGTISSRHSSVGALA